MDKGRGTHKYVLHRYEPILSPCVFLWTRSYGESRIKQTKKNNFMTTSALIMIILTQGTVIAATIYFFKKVLKTPNKTDLDS